MAARTHPGETFALGGDLTVTRMGYGAMQLAGPRVFGPPADRDAAVAVLREAVELGITHIDTSGYYGPRVTNQIIREALHPYPEDLVIVTKVGARRDTDGGWPSALAPDELRQAVHDNLENLGLDALDVVNLRVGGFNAPEPGSLAEPFGLFTGGELDRFSWNGVALQTDWKATLGGYCTATAYVSRPGHPDDLVAAVVGGSGKSSVWVYDP